MNYVKLEFNSIFKLTVYCKSDSMEIFYDIEELRAQIYTLLQGVLNRNCVYIANYICHNVAVAYKVTILSDDTEYQYISE